jgi:heme-degrading monooxygenase HmoA
MPASKFTTIWEFHVKADSYLQFEKIYGSEGDWAGLFRHSSEYRGTTLVRDVDQPGRYLTLDHWTSRAALQQFRRDHHQEYADLDKKCESLTEREILIGNFQSVGDQPGR